MVGTRKRGDQGSANRAAKRQISQEMGIAAKRQKLLEMEEEVKRERERLEAEEQLAEEERHQELERQRLIEERKKKKAKADERKRLKAKGQLVLEVEFSPEAQTATKLRDPAPDNKRIGAKFTAQWMTSLTKLKDFKSKFGHCRVPRRYKDDQGLANWVRTQRQNYLQQNSKMPDDRKALLEEMGFEFVVPTVGLTWDDAFSDLKDYQEKHGNCDIPQGYDESPQLLYWTFYQRETYRKGELSDERRNLLESIGFQWDHKWPEATAPTKSLAQIWAMQFEKLVRFKEQHGHLNIPASNYVPDPKLGRWIETQRTAYRRDEIKQERIQSAPTAEQEAMWQASFEKLSAFKAQNGHLDCTAEIDANLSAWIRTQRNVFHRNQMTQQRKEALESMGFDFGAAGESPGGSGASFRRIEHVWNSRLEDLKAFQNEFGHCNVPGTFARDPVLGRWVGTQRTAYRRGQMPHDRIEALESLGFQWRVTDASTASTPEASAEAWNAMLEKLKDYNEEQGNCNVPANYAVDPALARWVKTQRLANHSQRIAAERKQALDSLEFDWRIQGTDLVDSAQTWQEQFKKLQLYRELNGNCNVPRDYLIDPLLGRWVHSQRVSDRRNQISKEKRELLESLAFDWRIPEAGSSAAELEAMWIGQFEKLRVYKMANGHCNVPHSYAVDQTFARWVSTQRTVYRRNQMHEDRERKLSSLGFEWRLGPTARTWEESLNVLKEFKEKHGHCIVPKGHEDTALKNWVISNRQKFAKGTLPAEQVSFLESVGFAWTAEQEKQRLWDVRFQQLSQFSHNNGHCGLPSNFPEDPELLEWISRQHNAYFAKKMPEDRIEKLVSIGFVFDHDDDKKPAASQSRVSWNKQYEALLRFKELHGHTNVPCDYEGDPRLGRWVHNQRKLKSKGQGPTQDRIEKLNSLEFDWTLEQRRLSCEIGTPELKSPPVAAAAVTTGLETAGAGASTPVGTVGKATTPTVTWTRNASPVPQATVTQGVQHLAVNLEVERTRLDNENRQLKKANQKLQAANQSLTKRLTEAEAVFRKETQDLRKKLRYYDEMLGTQNETLQNHGQQLDQLAQNGRGRYGEQLKDQASTLQTHGNQLTQLAQQVQEMRQMQYTLQHQVGVQNLAGCTRL